MVHGTPSLLWYAPLMPGLVAANSRAAAPLSWDWPTLGPAAFCTHITKGAGEQLITDEHDNATVSRSSLPFPRSTERLRCTHVAADLDAYRADEFSDLGIAALAHMQSCNSSNIAQQRVVEVRSGSAGLFKW